MLLRRTELRALARQFAGRLQAFLETRVDAARLIALRLQRTNYLDERLLEQESEAMQEAFPGYLAINWIDSRMVIRKTVPSLPNRNALGKSLAHHRVTPLLEQSRKERRTTMSSPIELFQGGQGFTTYTPVFIAGEFRGWLNTVYRTRELWEQFPILLDPHQYRVQVKDAQTAAVLFSLGEPSAERLYETANLRMYGQSWQIAIAPTTSPLVVSPFLSPAVLVVLSAAFSLALSLIFVRLFDDADRLRRGLTQSKRDNLLLTSLLHDLSNPLQAAMANTELAQQLLNNNQPEQALVSLGRALKAIRKQEEITRFVREMHARTYGKLTLQLGRVALGELVADACNSVASQFQEKGIRITVDAERMKDTWVVAERFSAANHVLANILTNSLKFSIPGSEVQISIRATPDLAILLIRDHGRGMNREQIANLFNERRPTSAVGTGGESGTGLGLILARAYMELYGGTLHIVSRSQEKYPENHGTTVELGFRLSNKTEAASPDTIGS